MGRSKSRRIVWTLLFALAALVSGYLLLVGPRRVLRELDALRQDFADFYRNFFLEAWEGDG